MTLFQKKIIGAGIVCLVILSCYVPWTYTVTGVNGFHREKPAGYHPIFDPPRPEQESIAHGVKIDTSRVVISMGVVVLITIAAVMLTGPKRPRQDERELHGRTNGGTNEAQLAGTKKRTHPTPSDLPAPSIGSPAGAAGPGDHPAMMADHDRQERDGTALFSRTIAVVAIWGACRAVFGSEFGGFFEGFVVILIGSIVGPWVARRLSPASSLTNAATAAHNSTRGEAPPAPAGPAKLALSLVLIAIVGSAIGVMIVLLARHTDPPAGKGQPHAPSSQDIGHEW